MFRSLLRNLNPGKWNSRLPASALGNQVDTPSPPIYFVGEGTFQIGVFGQLILKAAHGRVVGLISDQLARYSASISLGKVYVLPVITLAAFREVAAKGPVEVVHFCEDLDQYWGLETIRACGDSVTIVDYFTRMYDYNLVHTYLSVLDEQVWWSDHQQDLERIAAMFGDQRSHTTLAARFEAIMSAQRRPLIDAKLPLQYEYFNDSSRHASLVPGNEEIYVDIGAAEGDTVDKFRQVTAGQYQQILAFEPSPKQYRVLAAREQGDSRLKTHPFAVGDKQGTIAFYENDSYLFGSSAIAGAGKPIDVQCVRLDDVVERCTLIKMDVEGYECNVLRGASRLIGEFGPDMAVTCYHYPQDMLEILELVASIHPYRHIALRHYSSSLFDSVLLFSDRQAFEA